MKEATGEGSMTIVTIVIITGIVLAAAVVIGVIMNKANSNATEDISINDEDDSIQGIIRDQINTQ